MPRGKPRILKEKEFSEYVYKYFEEIYYCQNEEDTRADLPSRYGFFIFVNRFKKVSFNTIRRCFDEYWADVKKEFEEIRADLLARGAALGKYNPTIVIFALKNWCKWTDKQEVTQETKLAVSDNFLDALSDSAAEDWESDEDETVEDSSV